ncbi:fungal-specific transcription factor domain-containing protein [Dipodascopsis uninucleata]
MAEESSADDYPSTEPRHDHSDGSSKKQVSYRRARASRACEICHSRKVRCDVTNRMPCTNCVAFGCECKIPDTRRRKGPKDNVKRKNFYSVTPTDTPPGSERHESGEPDGSPQDSVDDDEQEVDEQPNKPNKVRKVETYAETLQSADGPRSDYTTKEAYRSAEAWLNIISNTEDSFVKRSGRVAYLGSSSNLSLLVQSKAGDSEVCHYPLPEELRVGSARLNDIDPEEIEILHRRGAFLLPPRDICDDLVESFFEKIHPIVPMINRTQFMNRYNDPKNPPSILLLQSILLAGTRVCRNPALFDSSGSTNLASLTLYKRAKALFEANYEDDRISIVQSLILLGWWWEGPEDVTKNVFYWTRVAVSVAQGFGLHRSVEKSSLSVLDKRLWKRLWWVLFSRDRAVAVALGRPISINTDDADVPMLIEEDFIEEEGPGPYRYPPNMNHVQFFIQTLKLSEIMGLVLRQQFSVASENSRVANRIPDITHSDMALCSWMNNLPAEMRYNTSNPASHEFFKAILHLQYYSILCLLHRTNMSQARPPQNALGNSYLRSYPSRSIAFQAAHMIAKLIENLQTAGELKDVPAFTVYTLFSAMIMFVYQTKSQSPQVLDSAHRAMRICMKALDEVGETWMVAKMILRLFQKINDNNKMKDRIFMAVNPKHSRKGNDAHTNNSVDQQMVSSLASQQKCESQMTAEFKSSSSQNNPESFVKISSARTVGPNMSYERSSSKSPLTRPGMPPPGLTNNITRSDISVMPTTPIIEQIPTRSTGYISSRPTAPSTPSALISGMSTPGTPPDFFFVTHSPPISQTFLENFQPQQLFPEDMIPASVPTSSIISQQSESTSKSGIAKDWHQNSDVATNAHSSNQPAMPNFFTDVEFDGPIPEDLNRSKDAVRSRASANVVGSNSHKTPSLGEGIENGGDEIMPSPNNGGLSSAVSTNSDEAPNTLNLGDWYNYLVTSMPGEQFDGDLMELAQASGLMQV